MHPRRLGCLDRDIHSEYRSYAQTGTLTYPPDRRVQAVSVGKSDDRLTKFGTALHE